MQHVFNTQLGWEEDQKQCGQNNYEEKHEKRESHVTAKLDVQENYADSKLDLIEQYVDNTKLGREGNSSVSKYLEFGERDERKCWQENKVRMADQNTQ